jgi:hypothetical protein
MPDWRTSREVVMTFNLAKIAESFSSDRLQYLIFGGLFLGCTGLVAILYFSGSPAFRRFIGSMNPLLAWLLVGLLGFACTTLLLAQGWFLVYRVGDLRGLFFRSSLAALFVVISIWVDLKIVFPVDMNVRFPESLAFYPAIGFAVEILFHVLPLTLLLVVLTAIFKQVSHETLVWVCIAIVALLEPVFQVGPMDPASPLWARIVVGCNLLAFNLAQLYLFKRYDFISMYAFRLVYYLVWHIVWGYFRLQVLF